jgi:hypothetical protein
MKLVKSLLLGSAAGLAAVAGAQAADLPSRTVAPAAAVDYVRVCSTYGAGFFYIPGSTDTCLRIGGRVRAEAIYTEPFTRADSAIQFRARGRIQLDARTATSYGLLRTFVRFEITKTGSGPMASNLAQAFIQFGGLTAGRVTSFFSNPDLPSNNFFSTLRFDDSPDINLFAYTFNFGNGISASLSVEDGFDRRNNSFGLATIGTGSGQLFYLGSDPLTQRLIFQNPYSLVYGGQTVPDIVGNIKAAGTWGTVQLSGALHQIRDVGAAGRVNAFTGTALPLFADTEYGWAVMGTAGFNLPALGQGDAVWVAATYSSGAASYSGFGDTGYGTLNHGVADAVVNPVNGDLEKTKIWTVAGGFTHFWTPQLKSGVFGSYAHVEYGAGTGFSAGTGFFTPSGTGGFVPVAVGTTGLTDFNEWRIGANTVWMPVSGLQLGLEVLYAQADFRGRVMENYGGAVVGGHRLTGDVGAIEGRIRVQRDF